MSYTIPLEESVIIVTGAAGGIGREICRALRDAGAIVAEADLPARTVQPASSDSRDSISARYAVDVRSQESCDAMVSDVLTDLGRIDGLVNSAGIMHSREAALTTDENIASVIDTNAIGTFRMCRAVFPCLRKSGGSIVNIASTNGLIAVPNGCAYGMSKAAVIQLTRSLALEWAGDHIRVNSVAPGIVPTDMNISLRKNAEYLAAKLGTIPLGRMVQPDEVAHAVLYFLSAQSAMITGHTLPIDGGLLAQ